MTQALQNLLNDIAAEMQQIERWQSTPPKPDAFFSVEPFAIDTMDATEWLQWIFIPKMNALIESNAVLPTQFSIYPYFEEALKEEEDVENLLQLIQQVDELAKNN